VARLRGGWSAPGHTGLDRFTGVRISHRVGPSAVLLLPGDLAGDVGDDRTPARDVGGVLIETQQGGEIDPDLDPAPAGGVVSALAFE